MIENRFACPRARLPPASWRKEARDVSLESFDRYPSPPLGETSPVTPRVPISWCADRFPLFATSLCRRSLDERGSCSLGSIPAARRAVIDEGRREGRRTWIPSAPSGNGWNASPSQFELTTEMNGVRLVWFRLMSSSASLQVPAASRTSALRSSCASFVSPLRKCAEPRFCRFSRRSARAQEARTRRGFYNERTSRLLSPKTSR